MKFGNMLFLFLLPLWVALVLFIIGGGQKRRSCRLKQMVAQRLFPLLLSNYSAGRQNLKNLLFLCAIALIGFALAAPKWGHRQEERYVKGVDLLIAVDVSKSMLAEDIKPNRLERTKLAILDLIKSFVGHRAGLIAFAGDSFLQCPLTLDHNAFIQSLNAIDTDTIPLPGTAINGAIELAEKVYDQTQNQKLLFLFSDGEELADGAIEGAKRAKEQNVCIYTIGIGSTEGVTIPITDYRTGKVSPLCDRKGQIVKTSLDEKTLQEIAEITGGQYYHLSPAALSHLQRDILTHFPFLKENSKGNKYIEKVYQERYQLFLLLGFLLLLLEMLLSNYKKSEKYSISIYYQLSSLIFIFLFSLSSLSAKESKGETCYKNGEFEKALEFYDQQLAKKPDDQELFYNKGTTSLSLKRYEEAIDCLKKSIPNAPLALQKKAFYNLGNTFFEQGQSLPESQKTLEKWKESLRYFQSAVDLDGQFEEAKKNAKYVEEQIKKLEEQQKSQNQQESDKQKDQQNQDQQQDQNDQQKNSDQQKSDDQKNRDDQQKPDHQNQDQQQDQNDQQKNSDQQKSDDQKNQDDQQKPDHQNQDQRQDQNDQQKTQTNRNPMTRKIEMSGRKIQTQKKPINYRNLNPNGNRMPLKSRKIQKINTPNNLPINATNRKVKIMIKINPK
ncbi:MAG: VWA domain-containing protein [Puniceicoccales bacterium]|nr:VWA domain-containing protein [Puniceicoccales bacterium]